MKLDDTYLFPNTLLLVYPADYTIGCLPGNDPDNLISTALLGIGWGNEWINWVLPTSPSAPQPPHPPQPAQSPQSHNQP
jgi:hypothetical protein